MEYLIEKYGYRSNLFVCILCVLLFSSSSIFLFSDSLTTEENPSGVKSEVADVESKEKVPFSEKTPIDITTKADGEGGRAVEEFRLNNDSDYSSYTSNIIRLIFSLIFVVALAYVVIRLMRKGGRFFVVNDDAYLKLVASLTIEQGKSIKVFTLGDKAYVVGVTGSNITKIAEIEDGNLISAMNLKADETMGASSSFSDVFSNIFPIKKAEKVVGESSSFDDEFLKAQQDRIKNINIIDEGE